jgi:cytochrome c oxidase subunit 2
VSDRRRLSLGIDRFERNWMLVSLVVLVVFAAAVAIGSLVSGFGLPGVHPRVDPRTVASEGEFANPGLREIGPGEYEAYLLSSQFVFEPREITVPVGSTVTFYVTSVDVQHGMKIQDTNVNLQVIPGHVSTLSATFDRPGIYPFICTEFCGLGHQGMFGQVIVEETG